MSKATKISKIVTEAKSDYQVVHHSYSDAISAVVKFIKKNGYTYSEDEFFNTVSTGPRKPSDGKTNRFSIRLYKNDKEQKKGLHFQVTGIGNKYELNMYIL